MTTVTTIPAIDRLESALLDHPSVDVGGVKTCQLLHHFGPGIYIRELRRPPDTFIIGHAHKTKHLNILVSGDLAVYMAGKVTRFRAGDVFLSEAGVRELTYTVGGATLMTVHPTDETDVSKIEDELVDKSQGFRNAELLAFQEALT
jgi:quercetin dioxygenase-like cupin family protein